MMEQLAERRMQREEEAVGDLDSEDEEDKDKEDGSEDEEVLESEDDDEDLDRRRQRRMKVAMMKMMRRMRKMDNEEGEVMTEEQKMEEGKQMFSIFAPCMFEQRVFTPYREKVAQDAGARGRRQDRSRNVRLRSRM
ncbi:uncharacterized protein C8R40DRAFT_749601 [Lentinula edodes]|uniref:uncharacterized protein n=1 Tax=Lentinula edodes TaxID=5353 RepID=UPI001E8EB2C2|nr:uncharacterized protein C8R40DRAFT_749601 [Lentinula edodes]KAH7869234.1 hypothetical protein C8R40DRAFT_749601 [Lentinula edodes]